MGNDLGTDEELKERPYFFHEFNCKYQANFVFSLIFFFSPSVVTIGFSGTYSVCEDAGSISIAVLVLMNSLARDVVVTLSTVDGTASGGFAQDL